MKRKLTKFTSLFMAGMLAVSLLGGCGGSDKAAGGKADTTGSANGSGQAGSSEKSDGAGGSGQGKFSFAGDIVGQGAQALDDLVAEEEYLFNAMGSTFKIYNDNFTADTQGTNIQTMASAGYDGLMIFGWNATLYTTISNTAKEAKVPFVFFDQIPTDQNLISQLEENEYYVGSVGVDNYQLGVNIAKRMLDDGIKKAILLGGSVGDVVHDARDKGFTETFEAGGGQVLAKTRCTDPAEATTKEDDMISGNPDAEATYCLTGDYAIAAVAALENHTGTSMELYCSDVTTEAAQYIKDGTIVCGDGGSKIATVIASALLYNYANGNIIRDENGKAPNFSNIVSFEVNKDNAEAYVSAFLTGHPVSEEDVRAMIADGVTYKTFTDYIANFSLDTVLGK